MTDEEIDKLAKKIVDLMFKKQEEYDAQYLVDLTNTNISFSDGSIPFHGELVSKLERIEDLKKQLANCLENENYLKAAKIQNEIDRLET